MAAMDIEDLATKLGEAIPGPSSLEEVVRTGNCMGCGLCESIAGKDYIEMKVLPPKQRMRPVFHQALPADVAARALAACPGAQVGSLGHQPGSGMEAFIGPHLSIQKGYASDPETRFKAAAAGGLTSLAMHLISSKQVDFVVHVKACALYTEEQGSKLSFSAAEVFEGKGSRYGPVAPLTSLEEALRLQRPFALVAKPCDINAVRNFAKVDARVDELCKCLMTLSCGTYADNVCVDKFLEKHEMKLEEVEEFRWRGHGCPGDCPYVRAKDGREAKYDYVDFWFENGKDAGPLTYQWRCKMCVDFIGYEADVVVMDCWPKGLPQRRDAITPERKHEWDGWVLVIARTPRGQEVVDSAKAAAVLTLDAADPREIFETQPHQARRAASHLTRRLAHAATAAPLPALDAHAATRVAHWALDTAFVGEVMATGPAAPAATVEELREVLPEWAEAMLKLPEAHIAYHLDNYRGALKRLERGDAIESLA